MLAVGIFIRMISTDVTCSSSAIRIPIVFHLVVISATSPKTSTSRIKTSQSVVTLARQDSTKLSGLDANVDLIGEMMEQDGTTGWRRKRDGKKVEILVWFW